MLGMKKEGDLELLEVLVAEIVIANVLIHPKETEKQVLARTGKAMVVEQVMTGGPQARSLAVAVAEQEK